MSASIYYSIPNEGIIPSRMGCYYKRQKEKYDIFSARFDKSVKDYIFREQQENYDSKFVVPNDLGYYVLTDIGSKQEQRTVYHFFALFSEKSKSIIMYLRTLKRHKLWVNYSLFGISNPREQFLTIKIKRGINYFVFETPWAKPDDKFFIYLCKRENALEQNVFSDLLIGPQHAGYLYSTNNFLKNSEPFVFGIYPNDNVNIDVKQNALLTLENVKNEELLYSGHVFLIKRNTLSISNYIRKEIDYSFGLSLKIIYFTRDNIAITIKKHIYMTDLYQMQQMVTQCAFQYINSSFCNEYDKLCLHYKLKLLDTLKNNPTKNADNISSLFYNLQTLKKGLHLDFSILDPLSKRIFFKSKLDNTIRAYHAYIPPHYNAQTKYPLVIHFSTPELTNYSQYYSSYHAEPIISVDISQRGFTMGSYIGEAAILEAITDVLNRFSVDAQRIYALGHSNGAFAVWAIAQAYPHLFAGIMAVSGKQNLKCLVNIKNIYIINVSSKTESEYFANYCEPHNQLQYFTNVKEVLYEKGDHNMLVYALSKKELISELLKHKSNKYPNEIEFYTRHNRHRTSYWIHLHELEYTKKEMSANVYLTNNTINIEIKNSKGISLFVPPAIKKESFRVVINGKVFFFTNYKESFLHFTICNDDTIISPASYQPNESCYDKGNGLLDVFADELEILVANSSSQLLKCAEMLSSPFSAGADPQIHVKYPINLIDNASGFPNKNLILINNNIINSITKKVSSLCAIHMDESRFVYLNTIFESKYCILQIVSNPTNSEKNILYINTNDLNLLEKNLFTRRLIIPSLANGRHPYLNNSALIFDGKKYYGIFEFGMKMELIDLLEEAVDET